MSGPAPLPHLGLVLGALAMAPAPLPHLGLLDGFSDATIASVDYPAPLPHMASLGGFTASAGGPTYTLLIDPLTYSVTLTDAFRDLAFAAEPLSYAVTLQDVDFKIARTLPVSPLAYTVNLQPVSFVYSGSAALTTTRLDPYPLFPNDMQGLVQKLTREVSRINTRVNGLAEGRIAENYSALRAAPTTGNWQRGDYVINLIPAEQGTGGSKYVIKGWICIQSGTPGSWVEDRALTGN